MKMILKRILKTQILRMGAGIIGLSAVTSRELL
jgi:hypothetical protein